MAIARNEGKLAARSPHYVLLNNLQGILPNLRNDAYVAVSRVRKNQQIIGARLMG